ncbi:MAG: hypothetical protein AB2L09_09620 [Coriobacteriia bacterium]
MTAEPWVRLLSADPLPWLFEAEEPAARWLALTALLDRPATDADVTEAHAAVLADAGTRDLLGRLRPWDADTPLSGHDKPQYAPNLLALLGDIGVTAEDDERIAGVLRCMLEHQDADGRFQSYGRQREQDDATWTALLCDAHAIAETLARFGYAEDPRVQRAFGRMLADLADTRQGRAWPCRPDPATGFRGPGSRYDFCPQVTLEALRAFSYLPAEQRPAEVVEAGRVSLRAWRERGAEKPYMFGHGRQFKHGKWPATWYSAFEFVDVLGRYPELWNERSSAAEDRRALAEVAACLVAYNFGADGRVAIRSCFKGFESFSFGQKKRPSAFVTARVAVALRRLNPLVDEIGSVNVLNLTSSKGGTGTALPPS